MKRILALAAAALMALTLFAGCSKNEEGAGSGDGSAVEMKTDSRSGRFLPADGLPR